MINRPSVRSVLLAAALVAVPAVAEAKCVESASRPVIPGYVYVLDGEVIGTFAMDEAPPYPPAEEILVLQVVCKAALDSDNPRARQAAVMVATRSGERTLLTTYLRDLAAAMEVHRASSGSYPSDLAQLDFFDRRMTLPITLETRANGWKAVARLGETGLSCTATGRAADAVGTRIVCR